MTYKIFDAVTYDGIPCVVSNVTPDGDVYVTRPAYFKSNKEIKADLEKLEIFDRPSLKWFKREIEGIDAIHSVRFYRRKDMLSLQFGRHYVFLGRTLYINPNSIPEDFDLEPLMFDVVTEKSVITMVYEPTWDDWTIADLINPPCLPEDVEKPELPGDLADDDIAIELHKQTPKISPTRT